MTDLSICVTAVAHVFYGAARSLPSAAPPGDVDVDPGPLRDRGAISLEQVLWFVAAGVSVAVIAAILWNQIRDQANTPVSPPAAP